LADSARDKQFPQRRMRSKQHRFSHRQVALVAALFEFDFLLADADGPGLVFGSVLDNRRIWALLH